MFFSGDFFGAGTKYCTYKDHVNAPYIRKTFTLEALPQKVNFAITSSGFYQLFVNGKEITKCPLSPYITNPDSVLIYDTYDLLPYLNEGKNCIGMILGNGYVNSMGGFIWDFEKVPYRAAPSVAMHFEAFEGDRKVLEFQADGTMKTHPSPIVFDDFRSGVVYDANLEIENWCGADYDDSDWSNAVKAETPRGVKLPFDTDLVVVTETLKAVSIQEGKEQELRKPEAKRPNMPKQKILIEDDKHGYVYDFGVNCTFVPTIKIKGKKGQTVALQFCEYYENGEYSFENIARFYPDGYCQRDYYTCKSDKEETYTFPFTYHGARYCVVIGADKQQITPELVTLNVVNSDLQTRGDFDCSSTLVNRLQECVRQSDISNFVYFPTDCPHREKNGWTGDAAMSAEQFTLNFGVEKSLKQWMRLIRASQRVDGAIAGIIPTGGWGYAWGNGPLWDSVMVELPYYTYKYRGDISMFRENADMVMRYLHYISTKRTGKGIVSLGLGDWVHPGYPSGNPPTPRFVTDTIICVDICRKAAMMFKACGMKHQSMFAQSLMNDFRETARNYLLDLNTMTAVCNTQCAQAAAIYYDIFDNAEKPAAYAVLKKMIHQADDHFDCGMLGVRILFHVMADFGDADLAFKLITRTDAPSYGIWIEKFNCTSLPESFHKTIDGHTTSLNHHFLGDISNFFISEISGIHVNPHFNDPTYVVIKPNFIEGLDYAHAYYDTVKGKVDVTWKRDGNKVNVKVSRPEGVTAEVRLPDRYVFCGNPQYHGQMMVQDLNGELSCVKYTESDRFWLNDVN